jgi:cytochrome b561
MNDPIGGMALEDARYSRVAMWFHWIIAALIILNLILGALHDKFDDDLEDAIMWWHKPIGLSVLVLSLGRLAWRLGHRPPAFDPIVARWEVAAARLVHLLFYVLMIALPLTGWLATSANGRAVDFFGLLPVGPLPISRDHDAHEMWEEVHELLSWGMSGLIVLHVAGALKHYFEGHRHLIGRMGPWLYRHR